MDFCRALRAFIDLAPWSGAGLVPRANEVGDGGRSRSCTVVVGRSVTTTVACNGAEVKVEEKVEMRMELNVKERRESSERER